MTGEDYMARAEVAEAEVAELRLRLQSVRSERDEANRYRLALERDKAELRDELREANRELNRLKMVLGDLREVFWPGGDPDHQWGAETNDDAARLLRDEGFGPEDEDGRED